jgi:hypothetical protein
MVCSKKSKHTIIVFYKIRTPTDVVCSLFWANNLHNKIKGDLNLVGSINGVLSDNPF